MYVVDSHQKVLSAWAKYRCSLNKAPRLITLDHHTDTSQPFRHYFKHNKLAFTKKAKPTFEETQKALFDNIQFTNDRSVDNAITHLKNDEHIIAAIKTDIISSAFVIAHNAINTDIEVYRDHKIACLSVSDAPQNRIDSNYRKDCDKVIESTFLTESLHSFEVLINDGQQKPLFDEPYILDIDLDYFNTYKSVEPKDDTFFRALIKQAALITIATEPDYVKSCALDEGLTSSYIFEKLFSKPLSLS